MEGEAFRLKKTLKPLILVDFEVFFLKFDSGLTIYYIKIKFFKSLKI